MYYSRRAHVNGNGGLRSAAEVIIKQVTQDLWGTLTAKGGSKLEPEWFVDYSCRGLSVPKPSRSEPQPTI